MLVPYRERGQKDVAARETGVAKMRLQVFESQNRLAKGT